MKVPTHVLKDMMLTEISLVDHPASPGAHVALYKRGTAPGLAELPIAVEITKRLTLTCPEGLASFAKALDGGAQTFEEMKAADDQAASSFANSDELQRMVYALADSITSIFGDSTVDDPQQLADQSVDQFTAAIKETIGGQSAAAAGKTPADPPAPAAKPKPAAGKTPPGKTPAMSDDVKKAEEAAAAAFKKSHDDEIAKRDAEVTSLRKQLDDNTAEITKMREETAAVERLAKARTMTDGVPLVTADEVAGLMKGMSPEQVTVLEKTLAGAREAHKIGKTFTEAGAGGSHISASSSLQARIDKATADQMAADPKITKEKALTKALEAQPALYSEYVADRKRA